MQAAVGKGDFGHCEATSVGPTDTPVPCKGAVTLQTSVSPKVNPAARETAEAWDSSLWLFFPGQHQSPWTTQGVLQLRPISRVSPAMGVLSAAL